MIDRKQAKAKGVKVVVRDKTFADRTAATIAQLKQLLPNAINSDNKLDTRALADVLDIANTTSNNQGYELTFAGKGIARTKADSPTNLELKTELAQSKNFDKTDNVVIRGDNIDVLKILYQNYHNEIKMIYIDPPYNTQSENFVYNDNFKQNEEKLIEHFGMNEETSNFLHNVYGTRSHSGWLSFMYPRLKLARDLLADDGVIFISIDDNEQANLKIICDEIFGDDNFVANMVWHSNKNIMKGSNYVRKDHEYILVYRRSMKLNNIRLENKDLDFQNPDNDSRGVWLNTNATYSNGGHHFGIKLPTGEKCYRNWRFTEDEYKKGKVNLYFHEGNVPRLKIYKEDYDVYKKTPSSLLLKEGTTTTGKNQMASLFKVDAKDIPFDNPKDSNLIGYLLQFQSSKTDIVLDFFAGSGTTGDAVMQLNAEDGGNRKFILVQWDEKIDKDKNVKAHKFCTDNNFEPIISSITIERLNRASEKIKEEYIAKNSEMHGHPPPHTPPDFGYKVFSITDKPQVSEEDVKKGGKLFSVNNQRASVLDTLYNMLAATCKPLHTPIETLKKDVLYQADNELYLLANIEYEKLSEYADKKINLDGWADIDLEQFLNLDVPNKENITVIY